MLIACHNRRDTTRRCLESLERQTLPPDTRFEVFLVDDASTDGTGEMVRSSFPNVHVIEGSGDLYWTGGTSLAETHARAVAPDFLLWLNDDVVLDDGAISDLLHCSSRHGDGAIVIGSTREPGTSQPSYGGQVRRNRNQPLGLSVVHPNGSDQRADTMNGNVVLIPRAVRETVGPLEKRLVHNAADHDYGFRATAKGISIVVAPSFAGSCAFNDSRSRWLDPAVPLRVRWQYLMSFRGLPPRQWLLYTTRHCGWRWPRWFLSPYIHCVVVFLNKEKRS